MGEDIQVLPDGKNLLGYTTNQHPDFSGTNIFVNEGLVADIPSYQVVADNISPSVNKIILAIWNRLQTKRIRIQNIYCYPRTLANNTVTVQVGYITSIPTGGINATLFGHSYDNPPNPDPPNNVLCLKDNSPTSAIAASIIPNVIFGGATFSMSAGGNYQLFNPQRNISALQLRPNGLDGIVVAIANASASTGSLTTHVGLTLD